MSNTPTLQQTGARLGASVTIKRVKHPRYSHRASYVEAGQRKQKYFRSKKAAEDFAAERTEEATSFGTESFLTASERSAVNEYREVAERLGTTVAAMLADGARLHQKARELLTSPETLLQTGVNQLEEAEESIPFSQLTEKILEAKEHGKRSPRYLIELRSKLNQFCEDHGDRLVSSFTAEELSAWIHRRPVADTTKNSYRRILKLAFSFAKKRGYLRRNPIDGVDSVKLSDQEAEILTAEEARTLLSAASDHIRPGIAIGLFAGLRSSEIEGLRWEDIKKTTIIVRGENAKTRARRTIPISENLAAWLEPYRRASGKVWGAHVRKDYPAAKRAAGFGKPGTETKAEKRDGVRLRPWPKNCLRHSFGSYSLALLEDSGIVAGRMGHYSTTVLHRHYKALVEEPEEVAAYWAIYPEPRLRVVA